MFRISRHFFLVEKNILLNIKGFVYNVIISGIKNLKFMKVFRFEVLGLILYNYCNIETFNNG